MCAEGGVEPDEVYEVALAGNATMTHIVLGIDPEPLGMAPFILATRLYPEVLAADLGLPVHPRARAVVFPAFGAYVGGDITAGLLASGMDRDARVRLFVDIGTNCEIVLGNREWLLATAAPAGPAFEGAAIRCGMRAADGAIEVVTMTPDELTLKVIGDAEPQGLCGSGLVDAVTGLVRLGLLDDSGRLVTEEEAEVQAPGLAARLTTIGKERVFVLHWRGPKNAAEDSIYLSQRDVRELQFAKAAIATGWHILLEEAGLTQADVKQVLLAGSFGSYLSPAAAIRIGLVPEVPVQRVVPAGNVAGEGAKMALLSLRERAGGLALLEEVRYVELSDRADFNDRFVEQLSFPGGRRGRPRWPATSPQLTSSPAGRWPGTSGRSWPAAAGRSPYGPCPPCCTTGRRRSSLWPNGTWCVPSGAGRTVALAYADCGTYGALDELCARYGVRRLPGLHCYDVFAGASADGRDVRGRAGHLRADRLPAARLRPAGAGRAGLGPVPGAVAGLLRALPAAGLAGPGADPGAGGGGGAGGGDVRPAADPGRRPGSARLESALAALVCGGGPVGGVTELLHGFLSRPRFEVIPAKGPKQAVAEWVPAGMTVTVTASPVKGLEPTIELAERLAAPRLPGGPAPGRPVGGRATRTWRRSSSGCGRAAWTTCSCRAGTRRTRPGRSRARCRCWNGWPRWVARSAGSGSPGTRRATPRSTTTSPSRPCGTSAGTRPTS